MTDRGDTSAPKQQVSLIEVSDFDSIHQATLWRSQGPTEAIRRLCGALRTSVLIGENITLDRNQLFDGIFFLALGPEGIAAALGLAPHQPLPMLVLCQPVDGDLAPDDDIVPSLRGNQPEDLVSVSLQLRQVRRPEFVHFSSAMMALIDTREHAWLAGPVNEARWEPGAGLSNFSLAGLTDSELQCALQNAQDAWSAAILDGRVAVKPWSTGPLDVSSVLNARLQSGELNKERRLATFLCEQHSSARIDVATAIYGKYLDPMGTTEERLSEDEARLAMEAWSRAYYQVIAQRESAMILSFYDQPEDSPLARDYGLYYPVRSTTERLRDTYFMTQSAQTLRVDGTIIDQMQDITPSRFAQLYKQTRSTAHKIRESGKAEAMFDLALAVRATFTAIPTYREKRRATLLRIIITTLVTTAVTLLGLVSDLVDMSNTAIATTVGCAALIGFVAGLPWTDITDWKQLRKSNLTATLAVQTTPHSTRTAPIDRWTTR